MTISLAFLAPSLVKAAVESRLPGGTGSPGSLMHPRKGSPAQDARPRALNNE